MAILDVPLSLTSKQAREFLERELRFRKVLSMKVQELYLRVEHEPMKAYEVEEEVEQSCQTST